MKRLFLIFPVLLMLCSCVSPEEPATPVTDPAPAVTQAPTEPAGLLVSGHLLQEQTGGALEAYPLNRNDVHSVIPMGSDLLLFAAEGESTTLIKLCGAQLYEGAVTTLECSISPDAPATRVSEKGVTYFDPGNNTLVFLDAQLKEVSRLALPSETVGQPALSADRKHLYYLTADSLREMDLELGIHRLIRQMSFDSQTVTGLHWNDSVLECTVTQGVDRLQIFLNVSTGALTTQASAQLRLTTGAGRYFLSRTDGEYREKLTGTGDEEILMIHAPDFESDAYPVLNRAAVVTATAQGSRLQLDYYRLEDGTRPYAMQLPQGIQLRSVAAGASDAALWLLLHSQDSNSDVLCRWNLEQTAIEDDTVYIGVRRTLDAPDTFGLQQCRQLAEQISQTHGVQILIWTDATATQPAGHTLVPEHQVALTDKYLRILDSALSRYPAGMLTQASSELGDGTLRIALVRSITGSATAEVADTADSLQFQDAGSGSAYIVLRICPDLEQNLHHDLFHVIESRIFSLSKALDDWEDLNPQDFRYDFSYLYYLQREDRHLTEGDNRAFIDLYSMSFPMEDRARVMEYAMLEDTEDCFCSPIMQDKLRAICLGIREAYGLKAAADPLPWEQYLAQPMNPGK